jgi:hypothetical protein
LKILLKDLVQTPVPTSKIELSDNNSLTSIPQPVQEIGSKFDEIISNLSTNDGKSNNTLRIGDSGNDFKLFIKVWKKWIFDREYFLQSINSY